MAAAGFGPICLGARVTPAAVRPGGVVAVQCTFANAGTAPATADHQLFVHLEMGARACERAVTGLNHEPAEPTSLWRPGVAVDGGAYQLTIPADTPPGTCYVHVGVWAPGRPGHPRLCEAYPAAIEVSATAAASAPPPAVPAIQAWQRQQASRMADAAEIGNRRLTWRVSRAGCWELRDRATGAVWRSNPATARFAVVSFAGKEGTRSAAVSGFSSIRRVGGQSLELRWPAPAAVGGGAVRFTTRLLPGTAGVAVSWRQEGGGCRVAGVRFPDRGCGVSGAEDYLVVPNRLGLLLPAGGLPATGRWPTYGSYGGLSMAMAGAVQRDSGLLVSWNDPDTTLETRRSGGHNPLSALLDLSLAHAGPRGGVTLRPTGRDGYTTIARAYREVARRRGLLVTLRQKSGLTPDPLAGRACLRTLSLFNLAPGTPYNRGGERLKYAAWPFADIAATAEHLRRDLGIERGLWIVSGWNRAGYDTELPDLLPAAPESGGNAGLAACARRVQALGWLFGLHDNYQDIYRDSPSWDERFVMRNPDGSLHQGGLWFGGQAYLVNPARSLALAQRPGNLPALKRLFDPDLCYLDTTGAAPLYADYSPSHPLTRAGDLYWKRQLCRYARRTFGLFGTEEGVEWAVPESDYFESMLFQRTQRLSTEVLVPLFEMVYGDCVNIYQGDRTTTSTPGYLLDHLLCAEMPMIDVYRTGSPDLTCRLAAARRTGPAAVEVTLAWQAGQRPPPPGCGVFLFAIPPDRLSGARETAAFAVDYPFPAPARWTPGGTIMDGPHRVALPTGRSARYAITVGLLDQRERLGMKGVDAGNRRFLVGTLQVLGGGVRVLPPAPAPELCFARCDSRPELSYTAEGLLLNAYRVISPLQRLVADRPMTGHRFLTADRQVEQSRFGDVTITANYGAKAFVIGGTVLPQWGFLVESPRLVAYRADALGGHRFSQTTMAVVESRDGRPLGRSRAVRTYRAYGDGGTLARWGRDALSLVHDSGVVDPTPTPPRRRGGE